MGTNLAHVGPGAGPGAGCEIVHGDEPPGAGRPGVTVSVMNPDCLFCAIVAGDIPADIVYSDDRVVAFRDIAPKAPVHVLVVPRRHLADIRELSKDRDAAADVIAGVDAVAGQLGLPYFTTILNTGAQSGQTVLHVHAHILSGSGQMWAHGG
jgi:histidine triad (HIT) family protein